MHQHNYSREIIDPSAVRARKIYEFFERYPSMWLPIPTVIYQTSNLIFWLSCRGQKSECCRLNRAFRKYGKHHLSHTYRPNSWIRYFLFKRSLKRLEEECYKAFDILSSLPDGPTGDYLIQFGENPF